jgi:DNA-binding NarL/FixJ family response regulator
MEKKSVKILIVDDHAIVRDGIKTMLEMGDFDHYNFTILEARRNHVYVEKQRL